MNALTNTQRHQFILQKLEDESMLDVLQLSAELSVSAVTIRKDLRLLEERGLLFRTHGGASKFNPYISDRSIYEKEKIHTEEKARIAQAAAALIAPEDHIILASGTTVQTLAKAIETKEKLTVITNCLTVSLTLLSKSNINVIQLGGTVRKSAGSVTGPLAEQALTHVVCSKLFLGADGVDLTHGLTTSDLEEARLNRSMIAAVEEVIVIADSSKFGKHSFGKICTLDSVSRIITDSGISDKIAKQLELLGIQLVIV